MNTSFRRCGGTRDPDEDRRKVNDFMFHAFGLHKGKHTLRIRVLGENILDCKGSDVAINDVIVFE